MRLSWADLLLCHLRQIQLLIGILHMVVSRAFIIEDTQELDITVPVLDYMVVHPLEDAGYM